MRTLQALAAFSGAAAVIAGAYGAHGATGQAADVLRTGAQYGMAHAVAALVAARMSPVAAWLLLAGALLFAGSLYALALGAPHWLGPITPIGGLGMIAGWVWLGVVSIRNNR